MNVRTETTHHDRLQSTLELAGLELSASEVHGIVCGELCRRLKLGGDSELASLLGVPDTDDGAGRAVLEAVDALAVETRRSLEGGLEFSLLLPDEDDPISERTESLADWARGFVLALMRGDGVSMSDLQADSAEVVRDLSKISEAQPGEQTEEDERALTEIEEYMRVGVQLVFEELQPDDQATRPEQDLH